MSNIVCDWLTSCFYVADTNLYLVQKKKKVFLMNKC